MRGQLCVDSCGIPSDDLKHLDTQKRIREILRAEAEAIQSVPVTESFDEALDLLFHCGGKILTTGMGKAGLAARKFAATLCSTGTPAIYIHPGEAAHGDLGVIHENDCLVAFSTSGKTREVVEMLELGRHVGLGAVIGITSHPDSELRRHCDLVLEMGIIHEPCPLELTPSASIAVMNAIADALALVLMEKKGISRRDYGLRHHGGYLGRKARTKND